MLSMVFHTIKRSHVRFCQFLFVYLEVSMYTVGVDASDAGVDGAGAVVHVDSMVGTGVAFF